MNDKAIEYIETSFLKPLISVPSITDISYNGKNVYYLDNDRGRVKSEISVTREEVSNFIRQMANYTQSVFSFNDPILDVYVGKYRISALHHSIARYGGEGVITFSIRIGRENLVIDDDSDFFTPAVRDLLLTALKHHIPLIIGGETSSGKTELQKYLISKIPEDERAIIIDQVSELDCCHNFSSCDLSVWNTDNKKAKCSISDLVSVALRNNPDWLIIAETRDEEIVNVLNSTMTGHPIITTLHSEDAYSIPEKMSMLIMMNDKKFDYENVLRDIYYHFPLYIEVERCQKNGRVFRYISSIVEVNKQGERNLLYEKKNHKNIYHKLAKDSVLRPYIFDKEHLVYKAFIGGNDENEIEK